MFARTHARRLPAPPTQRLCLARRRGRRVASTVCLLLGAVAGPLPGPLGGWVEAVAQTSSVDASQSHIETAQTMAGWGMATLAEIEATMGHPSTHLYVETAHANGNQTGGVRGHAFVWPLTGQIRAMNQARILDPGTWDSKLWVATYEMQQQYWGTYNGESGYMSGYQGGTRFYDDNAHIAVGYVEMFRETGEATYLNRAKATYDFVLSGENNVAGGGIYFAEDRTNSKDTISTLQGARAAAMLAQAVGPGAQADAYLADAKRLLTWANEHVQLNNGLFNQGFVIANNAPGGVEIVNSAGIGISANLELYQATNDNVYLVEAERIADAAHGRYFQTWGNGSIGDEGQWAFELVQAYNDLSIVTGDTVWHDRVVHALSWLHENKQDSQGHYGLFWGREGAITQDLTEWHLNDMAPVAMAYLDTANTANALATLVPEPGTAGLLAASGLAAFSRRRRRPRKG